MNLNFSWLRLLVLLPPIGVFSFDAMAATDNEVQARSGALEVAGAFSNDGFKIRDGYWSDTISPKESKLIEVNLYAGNQYWFITAASDAAKHLSVRVYNENGKPISTEPYENNAKSAAGFSPQYSGPYYVRVSELEGAPAAFCLLYSYK
jgi:hypothetical protein